MVDVDGRVEYEKVKGSKVMRMWYLLLVMLSIVRSTRPLSAWRSIDYDKLERDWEEGDSLIELESDHDILYRKVQSTYVNQKIRLRL